MSIPKMSESAIQNEALVNNLLSALPSGELEKIEPLLASVELAVGDVLWESEEKRKYIYFPTTALICLLYENEDGVSVEVGIVGNSGLIGVGTYLGDPRMVDRAVVFRGGNAIRMNASHVKEEFEQCGDFQDMMMAYTQALIAQVSQTAICNRLHNIEQKLCRLLLIAHDHQKSDAIDETNTILMTHDQMSSILGVRRESVSIAAASLKDKGVIEYARGEIKLLSRKKLEAEACECYSVETEQYDKILEKYLRKHAS